MPREAMARRERELGYPSSHPHSPGDTVGFTLPSIDDILNPSDGQPGGSLSRSKGGREMVSPKVAEGKQKRKWQEPDPGSEAERDSSESNDQQEPTSSPVAAASPILLKPPTPSPRLFSTWLPDDSLPFIQTRLLSESEKETLGRRMSETKTPPSIAGPLPSSQEAGTSAPRSSPRGPGPQQTSPSSSQTQTQSQPQTQLRPSSTYTTSPLTTARLPRPTMLEVPPHPSHRSQGQGPFRPPGRLPQLRRAHTTDLELLRQVKSNNLTLPSPFTSSTAARQVRSSPFTMIPLPNPASRAIRPQEAVPVTRSGYGHDRHTTPAYPRNQYQQDQQQHLSRVHPPSSSGEGKRPYPSVLEPVSPRSMVPSREIHPGPRSAFQPIQPRLEERVAHPHPYSREMAVSRVRGGHAFRHQR